MKILLNAGIHRKGYCKPIWDLRFTVFRKAKGVHRAYIGIGIYSYMDKNRIKWCSGFRAVKGVMGLLGRT